MTPRRHEIYRDLLIDSSVGKTVIFWRLSGEWTSLWIYQPAYINPQSILSIWVQRNGLSIVILNRPSTVLGSWWLFPIPLFSSPQRLFSSKDIYYFSVICYYSIILFITPNAPPFMMRV